MTNDHIIARGTFSRAVDGIRFVDADRTVFHVTEPLPIEDFIEGENYAIEYDAVGDAAPRLPRIRVRSMELDSLRARMSG